MELEIKIGGITYEVEVDVDEESVVGVMSVNICDNKNKKEIEVPMTIKELNEFYERYQDDLNDKYITECVAKATLAMEERGQD